MPLDDIEEEKKLQLSLPIEYTSIYVLYQYIWGHKKKKEHLHSTPTANDSIREFK